MTFHSLTLPSFSPVAKTLPSGLKATARTEVNSVAKTDSFKLALVKFTLYKLARLKSTFLITVSLKSCFSKANRLPLSNNCTALLPQ